MLSNIKPFYKSLFFALTVICLLIHAQSRANEPSPKLVKQINHWLDSTNPGSGILLVNESLQANSDVSFIEALKKQEDPNEGEATGSGNAGGPLSQDSVKSLRSFLQGFAMELSLELKTQSLETFLNSYVVYPVDFELCSTRSKPCRNELENIVKFDSKAKIMFIAANKWEESKYAQRLNAILSALINASSHQKKTNQVLLVERETIVKLIEKINNGTVFDKLQVKNRN